MFLQIISAADNKHHLQSIINYFVFQRYILCPTFIFHPHKYILYRKPILPYCLSWSLPWSYCYCSSFSCNLFPVKLTGIKREWRERGIKEWQLEWKGKMLLFCVNILVRARLAEAINLNCYSFLDLRVIYHIIELVCHLSHHFNHTKCVALQKQQRQ